MKYSLLRRKKSTNFVIDTEVCKIFIDKTCEVTKSYEFDQGREGNISWKL